VDAAADLGLGTQGEHQVVAIAKRSQDDVPSPVSRHHIAQGPRAQAITSAPHPGQGDALEGGQKGLEGQGYRNCFNMAAARLPAGPPGSRRTASSSLFLASERRPVR